jgi:hypothetical protein
LLPWRRYSISPALLQKDLSVARMISRLAVGNTNIKPSVEDLPSRRDGPGGGGRERNERASDDLPFDSRGGFAVRYYFPVDAEYVIRVRLNQGGVRTENFGDATAELEHLSGI